MTVLDSSREEPAESFDQIAHDLHTLKGSTSYGDLVRLITEVRLARGVHAAAAVPARSTVYDALRTGRTRMDRDLLRDIVCALGADAAEAARWVERCNRAHALRAAGAVSAVRPAPQADPDPTQGPDLTPAPDPAQPPSPDPAQPPNQGPDPDPDPDPDPAPAPDPDPDPAPAPAPDPGSDSAQAPGVVPRADPAPTANRRGAPVREPALTPDPSSAVTPARAGSAGPPATQPRARRPGRTALLLLSCTLLNILGNVLIRLLGLPIYLDMVGTAIAAITMGPWYGAVVAVGTGLAGSLYSDSSPLFLLVGVVGALVWGYGVRKWNLGADLTRFFALNLIVAAASTLVATPILLGLHGGRYGVGQILVTDSLIETGLPLIAAVFSANIVTSVLDKLLSGFVALFAFTLLHRRLGFPTAHMPLVQKLETLGDAHPT